MAKLKFKAWSPKWKKMIFSNTRGYSIQIFGDGSARIWKGDSCDDKPVIMQAVIGTRDKNGKQVFVSDVYRYVGGDCLYRVFYSDYYSMFMGKRIAVQISDDEYMKVSSDVELTLNNGGREIELVGNKYNLLIKIKNKV